MSSGAQSPKSLYLGITPEFLDEESRSICPLLTPSPTAVHFRHPLSSPGYDQQQSPSSGDTEISSLPPALCTTAEKSPNTETGRLITDGLEGSSSSSSCSVMQDSGASAQLLNYFTLSADPSATEKGGIKSVVNLLGLSKQAQEYSFVSWNWAVIRRWCFWGVMSLVVACICIIIGYISTIPRRCDPSRSWYQGTLIYQIFPPSFQDTDGNGMGDLKGITSRIGYLDRLGVRGVRLSYIFPSRSYPEHFQNPDNLTQIDHSIGTFKDFEVMIENLHRRNISVVLDIPLFPFFDRLKMKSDEEEQEVKHVIVNNHILVSTTNKTHGWVSERSEITDVLLFWLNIGVDGFYLEGLEHFLTDELFISQIFEWRAILNKYNQGFEKILICSEEVVKSLTKNMHTIANAESKLNVVMRSFDLINVHLDPFSKGVPSIKDKLHEVQNGVIYSKPGYPWVYWTSGGVDTLRLASKAPYGNVTMALLLTTMVLPGTTGIFYGDEIGLLNVDDEQFIDVQHLHQLAPMHWSDSPSSYGFSLRNIVPWMKVTPARLSLSATQFITQMSIIKDASPGLYMNAMWKNDRLIPNSEIRYIDENVLLLERNYPRRHTFLLMANIGKEKVNKDFSSHYYGGVLILDTSGGAERYATFQDTQLVPGQAIIAKLDK
ncbi:alpha-glucosidase isoform X1 [Halyomorpha halys]|uniref:alpha-glucosidase isoform X1 n=1 Tax=Halyomorpha halys TaxID=286706 RepID=UPI0006D511A0|nr:neutral and basic amino acid transport protein rBAT-like [Halyomorpha halys]